MLASSGLLPGGIPILSPRDLAEACRGLESWIELAADAYRGNLRFLRGLLGPGVELAAVVKANAYGHGRRQIAALALDAGADSFAVHALEEALDLRAAGFHQDVLIMGHVPRCRLREVIDGGFRLVLYDLDTARTLAESSGRERPARVHLKIETGTHRQGVDGEELDQLLDFLADHPRVELEGAYTHFADIEDTTDHHYARRQLERFLVALGRIHDAGFELRKRHSACSAAAVLLPGTHFDMVRLGISQYGFWSSKETRLSYEHQHGAGSARALTPVLTWKTRISQLKRVPADAFVGYGRTFRTTRPTRLAVLPVGYADGYDRHLSGTSHVLVRGRHAPVRGRICMNLTMVDVTDIPDVE
ncbi:MAG: alanine racemase, partial [Holophagales bacterium]|nr:alanine racemase [Holophagales bacterium]